MIFDYSGGSDVNLTWNEEDHDIVKNFLRSNFKVKFKCGEHNLSDIDPDDPTNMSFLLA